MLGTENWASVSQITTMCQLKFQNNNKYIWCHSHGIMWLNTTNNMLCTIDMRRWKQHRTLNLRYYCVDHTPHCRPRAAAQTHCAMAMFSLHSNIDSNTRPWQRADIASRFARGSVACQAGLSKRAVLVLLTRAREYISMALRPWPTSFVHTAQQFWPIVSLLNL